MRLGELLVGSGLLTSAQRDRALAYHQQWRCKLGEAVVQLSLLGVEQVQRMLASQLRVPFVKGEEMAKVPAAVVRSVPDAVLMRLNVCPLQVDWQGSRGVLYVATHQPENLPLLDELAFVTRFTVRPVLAQAADIERTLRQHGVGLPRGRSPIELPPDDDFRLEVVPGSGA
ncbi:MAG TPA: pilus assembly protein PilB [Myxococcus sp.]|nr:pilus assembly protein PilB [Myxococcus sp.]